MISGTILGQGVAGTQGRVTVPYWLIRPDKSPASLAIMALEARRWRTTSERYWEMAGAGKLDPNAARRAQFADEVMATAAEAVRQGRGGVLLAQAQDGRILGISQYLVKDRTAYLLLQTTDPEHQPGSPGAGQLRGIGTALLSGVVQSVAPQVDTLYLKPLDQQAAMFWSRRGFQPCEPGSLCVRGQTALAALRVGCQVKPDCPEDGECLVCGLPADTVAMRVPARQPSSVSRPLVDSRPYIRPRLYLPHHRHLEAVRLFCGTYLAASHTAFNQVTRPGASAGRALTF